MNIIKNRVRFYFFHLMVWGVLFSLPYLLSTGQSQVLINVFAHSWVPLVFFAFIFYANYLLIIDRFLFKKKIIVFVIINALLITVSIWLRDAINSVFFQEIFTTPKNNNGPPRQFFIYLQLVSLLVPVVFSIALKTTERWIKTEAERNEAANIKLQSELQHLRYQLQPHFFFNSLNNIYSLVDVSPEQAKTTIHSLSKLMRYLLYETSTEKVALTKEIDFLKKYIDLMTLRLMETTKVVYKFPTEETNIQIAPLMFISLIENAFKHGVSANKESLINIEMTTQNNIVNFKIDNYNFPKKDSDKSGSGIGLQNLEKRLQLLYPYAYSYQKSINNDIFTVELKIET